MAMRAFVHAYCYADLVLLFVSLVRVALFAFIHARVSAGKGGARGCSQWRRRDGGKEEMSTSCLMTSQARATVRSG
jgi:hypothetical protein